MIPIFNPIPQYEILKHSIDKALIDIASSGHYILGPQVKQFEEKFADYAGTKYSAGVNSGTDALFLSLKALDIGPGDEVITTCFSYVATSEIIVRTGARPVFVDIDPKTFNIDLNAVEKAITERTRAIIPVHLFGMPVDMTELMKIAQNHGIYVVEDCAQATGATWQGKQVGSFGHLGCFSFFPTKNLGAMGDGGSVTTNDSRLAERIKSIRVHGSRPDNKYDHQEPGINSRLDTMQAAVLLLKLQYLDKWNTERRQTAQYYTDQILSSELERFLTPPEACSGKSVHVFHQYTVRLNTANPAVRDQIQTRLKEAGVTTMIYYPIPLHLQKTHENLGYQPGSFPVAEEASKQVLSLPIFPGLTQEQQETVISTLQSIVTGSLLAS